MNIKKIVSIFLICVCFALTSCSSGSSISSDSIDETSSEKNDEDDNRASSSELEEILKPNRDGFVEFGTYEQDGNLSNGPEPIEWIILDTTKDGTLLVSRYVLDDQAVNEHDEMVTWETCTLRTWLNTEFYNEAFSDEDKQWINTVTIENEDSIFHGTSGGNPTTDNVFLLSESEARSYFGDIYWLEEVWHLGFNQQLIVSPTVEAVNRGAYAEIFTDEEYESKIKYGYSIGFIGTIGTAWWLRSPSYAHNIYTFVSADGGIGKGFVLWAKLGIRPAIYISSEKQDVDTWQAYNQDSSSDNEIQMPADENSDEDQMQMPSQDIVPPVVSDEDYSTYLRWNGDYSEGWMDTIIEFNLFRKPNQKNECGYAISYFRGNEDKGPLYYLGSDTFEWIVYGTVYYLRPSLTQNGIYIIAVYDNEDVYGCTFYDSSAQITSESEEVYDIYVTVAAPDGYVNFRTGPGTNYDIIMPIVNGEQLWVIGEKTGTNWIHVKYLTSEGYITGWVNSTQVQN